jgi:hypothetical protein
MMEKRVIDRPGYPYTGVADSPIKIKNEVVITHGLFTAGPGDHPNALKVIIVRVSRTPDTDWT